MMQVWWLLLALPGVALGAMLPLNSVGFHQALPAKIQATQQAQNAAAAYRSGGQTPRMAVLAKAHLSPACLVPCPKPSVCKYAQGTPLCVCPSGYQLVGRSCMNEKKLPPHSDWLVIQNMARAALGVRPLQWNDGIAKQAAIWAKVAATTWCAAVHGNDNILGQNVAGGSFTGWQSVSNAFVASQFVLEGGRYTFAPVDGGCATGSWDDCGHYTQVIWGSTQYVGCDSALCPAGKGKVWVCDYSPGGNVVGQYPYYRNPCFQVKCSSGMKCAAYGDYAFCMCPKGTLFIKGKCQRDPCKVKPCPGNLVCTPTDSGGRTCSCASGWMQASWNHCIPNLCSPTLCPAHSACAAVPGTAAVYCSCRPGYAMVNQKCRRVAARTKVAATTVALYTAPNFRNTPKTVPTHLIRAPSLGGCYNIPRPYAGRVGSYTIVWNTPIWEKWLNKTLSQPVVCRVLYFWDQRDCYGHAMGWPVPYAPVTTWAVASSPYNIAQSLSCG